MLYIVGGLRRTGTSMMMHCMGLGGLELAYDDDYERELKGRDFGNDYYYELRPFGENTFFGNVMQFSDVDGKCIKDMGVGPMYWKEGPIKVVYMQRNPRSQMLSLRKSHGEIKPQYAEETLYDIHVIQENKHIESCHVFDYDAVLKRPLWAFQILADSGWPIDPVKAITGIDISLKHY